MFRAPRERGACQSAWELGVTNGDACGVVGRLANEIEAVPLWTGICQFWWKLQSGGQQRPIAAMQRSRRSQLKRARRPRSDPQHSLVSATLAKHVSRRRAAFCAA